MSKKPTSNFIPAPLQFLSLKELFICTGISLHKLEGVMKGEFKLNEVDRKKMSIASMPFYAFNRIRAQAFITKKKFRAVRQFLSIQDKNDLLSDIEKYEKNLDAMVDKYWDRLIISVTEKFA